MPRDFAIDSESKTLEIRNADGFRMPFSKGIMATSILATGLETGRAYRIAADIGRELARSAADEMTADQLAAFAAEKIEEAAGLDAATRYLAWRSAKRTGRPIVVCLAGAPGVGKSTFATRLALRLGVNRVVPTDAIREVLRSVVPDTVLPELHVSTYEQVDDINEAGSAFLRQARAVSAATAAVAKRLTTERRSVILEGVHILPGDVTRRLADSPAQPIVVERLLTLDDERIHRAHLSKRARAEPDRDGDRHVQRLATIREQQELLRRLARNHAVDEHDITHPGDLTQRIVDDVVSRSRIEAPR